MLPVSTAWCPVLQQCGQQTLQQLGHMVTTPPEGCDQQHCCNGGRPEKFNVFIQFTRIWYDLRQLGAARGICKNRDTWAACLVNMISSQKLVLQTWISPSWLWLSPDPDLEFRPGQIITKFYPLKLRHNFRKRINDICVLLDDMLIIRVIYQF